MSEGAASSSPGSKPGSGVLEITFPSHGVSLVCTDESGKTIQAPHKIQVVPNFEEADSRPTAAYLSVFSVTESAKLPVCENTLKVHGTNGKLALVERKKAVAGFVKK